MGHALRCQSIQRVLQLGLHGRRPERTRLFISPNAMDGMERSRQKTDDQPGGPLVHDHFVRGEYLGLSGPQQHRSHARCSMETGGRHDLQSQHADQGLEAKDQALFNLQPPFLVPATINRLDFRKKHIQSPTRYQ